MDLTPQPAEAARPRSLWRNRDYMLLWSGQAISRVGSRASALALPLLALALTGSPAQAGFLGALAGVPSLTFGLLAGAFVDRWEPKRTMMWCDCGRALALGSVPVALALGRLTIAQLYMVVLIEGTFTLLFDIAQATCIPRVVPKEQLPAAAAQTEALFPVGDFVGPPLGGALYQVRPAIPFLVDALSYAAHIGALFAIRTTFRRDHATGKHNLRMEIGEGITWLWRQPLLRFLSALSAGAFFVDAGGPLVALVIMRDRGTPPATIGLVSSIAAAGGFIGFALVGPLGRHMRFGRLMAATVIGQALVWPLIAVAPNALVIGLDMAWNYLVFSVFNSVEGGYRLARVPEALRGRVNSVFRLLFSASFPLGSAFAGLLIQWFGARQTAWLFFAWLLVLALCTIGSPSMRRTRALPEIAREEGRREKA